MFTKNLLKRSSKKIEIYYANSIALLILAYVVLVSLQIFERPGTMLSWVLTFVVSCFLIDGLKIVVESFSEKHIFDIKTDQENLAVLIVAHNAEKLIEDTVRSVRKTLDSASIYVVDDASIDNTVKIAESAGATVIRVVKNRGKVGAIHYAVSQINKPYFLLLDDDTELNGAKIPTNLLKDYDAVSLKVLPYGDNILDQFQRHEYRKSAEIGRKFNSKSASVACISGACGLFNREVLIRQTRTHSGHFSGEDLQRTLLIHRDPESKGVVSVDELVMTHAPRSLRQLYKQRVFGWWPGLLNNLHHFAQLIFARKTPGKLRFEAVYSMLLILTDPLRIITLPVLFAYPEKLLIFYLFYVGLEFIPYMVMKRSENPIVVMLAPIYGIFNLFTRTMGIFVWIYRWTASIKKRGIADPYLSATLPQQIFASSLGGLSFASLMLLGIHIYAL